jgi:transporter family-2 protein
MLLVGALAAVQSQVNSELAEELGGDAVSGITAALVSFGGGLALLCAGIALSPAMRAGLSRVRASLRHGPLAWWQVVGGGAGAFVVATQGLTVGTIGVALFTVALVGGQTASSLAVDQRGLGPAGRTPVTTLRALGAALAVGAVALSASERLNGSNALSAAALALALLPLLAGAGIAWQQAVNGVVSQTGGPWAATWLNFAVGTAVLLAATGIALVVQGPTRAFPSTWWMYSGGVFGVLFICFAAVFVRVLGVLVLGLCIVTGQVAGSLAVDHVLGAADPGPLTILGAIVALAGVLLAGLSSLRASRRARLNQP